MIPGRGMGDDVSQCHSDGGRYGIGGRHGGDDNGKIVGVVCEQNMVGKEVFGSRPAKER